MNTCAKLDEICIAGKFEEKNIFALHNGVLPSAHRCSPSYSMALSMNFLFEDYLLVSLLARGNRFVSLWRNYLAKRKDHNDTILWRTEWSGVSLCQKCVLF